MHAATSAASVHRMLQVQHLVVYEIFHGKSWSVGTVKNAADDDGVVRGIVVAERAARVMRAPCQLRPAKQPVKIAGIQTFEHFIKVVVTALRCRYIFSPAHLPHPLSLL